MTTTPPARKKRAAGALAALDRRGGAWRFAIAHPGAVVERETLADLSSLRPRLEAAGVARLVRTAPACECLARLSPAPDASGEDLAPALALIADAALPEDIPAYRRAASLVGPLALAAGWAAREDAAPRIDLPGVEETWAAEPAAWLAFANEETGAILAWDREQGSVFAARLAGKPLARCLRLDPADPAAWARGLAAAAASVGLTAGDAPSGIVTAGPLFTDGWQGVTASAIAGDFGPALGALRLALDEASTHATPGSPASLRRAEDDGREPALTRAGRWVSHPARTPWLIAAAALVAVASPVAFAYARLKIVEAKLAALGPAQEKREALIKEAALYRQMDASRWPMTKFFADLANATPVGITVDNLTIEHEGGQGITVKGHADSAEVLNTYQRNLNLTGILAAVRLGSIDADNSGISFQVQAKVASAKSISRVTDDYGKKTLSTRLWVEGTGPKTLPPEHTASPEDETDHTKGPELATTDTPSGGAESGNGGGSGGDRRGSTSGRRNGRDTGPRAGRGETASSAETNKAAKPMEVPPPLTQAELDAMDKSAAVKAWAERRSAAQRDTTPAEDKARLEEEVEPEAKWKGGAS